ncbi:MAG: ABC transporter permease [Lachnospiraceae bacterium]|nr:ABC transporter permease [Lachnospiraceae bacterium]
MFWHLYKYRVKVMLKNKYLFFWMGIFPIVLGTLFFMTFSNITDQVEGISTINVVVATDGNGADDADTTAQAAKDIVKADEALTTFLGTMEEAGYFAISYADYDAALTQVDDKKATGILVVGATDAGTDISLLFGGSGMNETILKNIINTYKRGANVIADTIATDPTKVEAVIAKLYSDADINVELSVNAKNNDPYNQYFFALFSMVCMFGASYGMVNTEYGQADQSPVGTRRCTAPTKKMMMVFSEFLAAVTVIELMFVILFFYLTCVLGLNLGDRYGLIFLASIVSSFFGVAFGYAFGVLLKCKQSAKDGIMMAVILFLNFLAGLMMGNMKFIIEKNLPIVNRINPAAIISDCFYSICAYDDTAMYTRCIASIVIWTVALTIISIVILRREKYANL